MIKDKKEITYKNYKEIDFNSWNMEDTRAVKDIHLRSLILNERIKWLNKMRGK